MYEVFGTTGGRERHTYLHSSRIPGSISPQYPHESTETFPGGHSLAQCSFIIFPIAGNIPATIGAPRNDTIPQ